jgi:hypothetical protein
MPALLETVKQFSTNFSLAEALTVLKPMSLFILGVAVYAFFIFKFYRYVARRDVFKLDLKKHDNSKYKNVKKSFSVISYLLKHLLLLPIIIFFWFIVLTIILAFLSKQGDIQTLLLVSIALVGAIRIMSYYSEDLSKDLAKMLPFALLGVFLVDISYFSFSDSWNTILQIPTAWKTLVYYLLFIILLETILRILHALINPFRKEKTKPSQRTD